MDTPTFTSVDAAEITLGVISDTHGLLRAEALAELAGVDHIVHAGDIGAPQILERLQVLAPVTAVRGNNDKGAWAEAIPEFTSLEIAGRRIHVVHEIAKLDLDPGPAGIAVVIAGHSHKPTIEEHDGVLFLNPGSAGPRRFRLPVAVAKLHVSATSLRAEILELRIST